jgi:hypothetical protein
LVYFVRYREGYNPDRSPCSSTGTPAASKGHHLLDNEWGIVFTQGWLGSVIKTLGNQEAAEVEDLLEEKA